MINLSSAFACLLPTKWQTTPEDNHSYGANIHNCGSNFLTGLESWEPLIFTNKPGCHRTMELEFEWDDHKAKTNLKKHGVSFEDAKTVFKDPDAYIFNDEWHSVDEQREIIIGHDRENRLLLVCFTERQSVIRIISARLATKKERREYEQYTSS